MTQQSVRVWLFHMDQPAAVAARLGALLDEDERRRVAGRRDACRATVAHGVARIIIGRSLGAPPEQLRWRRGRHGKPELTGRWMGVQANLSHSGHLAALALSRDRPVGVDVEHLPESRDPVRLARRFYPAEDARYVAAAASPDARADRYARLWVRKEACVKALGGRLMPGLAVPVRASGPAVVQGCLVRDFAAPDGFRAAVAAAGPARYRLLVRWWTVGD